MFGLFLAAFGALLLSPDTLMMRLSGLDGFSMLAWRGLLIALALLGGWLIFAGESRRRDLATLGSRAGLVVVCAQIINTSMFSLAISVAPVSVVLFGLATVPIFGAIFAWLLLKEPTRRATWVAICAVLLGIGIAVFGGADGALNLDFGVMIGALGGLCVAASLALTFVVCRMSPDLSIPLALGVGGFISGMLGLALAGADVTDGTIWPIFISGAIILPVSFFALSFASRYTHASNVSLMLLLETVLGPVFVWIGVGEAPTMAMNIGGAIVVGSLAIYLLHTRRRAI